MSTNLPVNMISILSDDYTRRNFLFITNFKIFHQTTAFLTFSPKYPSSSSFTVLILNNYNYQTTSLRLSVWRIIFSYMLILSTRLLLFPTWQVFVDASFFSNVLLTSQCPHSILTFNSFTRSKGPFSTVYNDGMWVSILAFQLSYRSTIYLHYRYLYDGIKKFLVLIKG